MYLHLCGWEQGVKQDGSTMGVKLPNGNTVPDGVFPWVLPRA